jgi:hypothetical protein
MNAVPCDATGAVGRRPAYQLRGASVPMDFDLVLPD